MSTRVARLLVALGDDAFGAAGRGAGAATTLASLTLMAQRIAKRGEGGDALVRKLLAHRDRTIRRAAVHALAQAIRAGERPALRREVALPLVRAELSVAFRLLSIDAALSASLREPGGQATPANLAALRSEVALRLEASRGDVLELLSLLAQEDRTVASSWSALVDAVEASRRAPSDERDAQVVELLENALGPGLREPVVALFERTPDAERALVAQRAGLLAEQAPADLLAALVEGGDLHLRRMAAVVYGAEYAARYPDLAREDEPMIPRFERIRFLRRVPLFASLPGEDLVSVAAVLEQIELADGEAVFHRGDRGEDLFVVVSGKVRIGDASHVLAELGETEFFGDLAVLDHEGRSADASCRGATTLLRLRGADLRELMATRPEITQGIVRVLVARLRDAGRKLAG